MKTWQKLKQNPELFQRYFVKEYAIKTIRKYFEALEYHELESPIIAPALPQERYLDVLSVNLELLDAEQNKLNKEVYLLPSTETFNKKILAAGLGNHFVVTKVFRGLEEISTNHSPEFTMLEWYELDHTYLDLMNTCERLILEINNHLNLKFNRPQTNIISYQGQSIDLTGPWPKYSCKEAFQKWAGLDLHQCLDLEFFRKKAIEKGYRISDQDDWQTIFEIIFANEIESNFPKDKPVFIYDYPQILCPLTKTNAGDPSVCEKVELYLAGKEIANGYTELRDWQEQEKRFKEEQTARAHLGKKPIRFDQDLVEALKSGLPPVAGMGMGIDRLVMILADAADISEINFFPATEYFND